MGVKIQLDRNKAISVSAKENDEKVDKKDIKDRLKAIEDRLDKLEKKAAK